MVRRADVVRAIGRGFRATPVRPLARWFFRRHVSIVFYHGLWPEGSMQIERFGGLDLGAFRRDMRLLSEYFRFVSLDEILCLNRRGVTPPKPVIAVCFDDGHDMLRTGALNVLEEFGIRATVFVVNACVGNRHLMWMHKFAAIAHIRGAARLVTEYNRIVAEAQLGPPIAAPAELSSATRPWPMHVKETYADAIYAACDMPPVAAYLGEHQPYMTWDGLRVWLDRGHNVGVHTRTHPFCSRLGPGDLDEELVAAAEELRERLLLRAVPFAYPFGDRLTSRETERKICERGRFSCMLGVDGLSRLRTEPWRLERVDGEVGLDIRLFGRPLVWPLLRRA